MAKRDIFFDTKHGRIILMVLAILVLMGGIELIVSNAIRHDWHWFFIGICDVCTGSCMLIFLKRRSRRQK